MLFGLLFRQSSSSESLVACLIVDKIEVQLAWDVYPAFQIIIVLHSGAFGAFLLQEWRVVQVGLPQHRNISILSLQKQHVLEHLFPSDGSCTVMSSGSRTRFLGNFEMLVGTIGSAAANPRISMSTMII